MCKRREYPIAMPPAAGDIEDSAAGLVADLRRCVGRGHVLTNASAMRRYCTGFRFGAGRAVAVVRPGSLVEQWRVLNLCVAANRIVIVQAALPGAAPSSPTAHSPSPDVRWPSR